MLGCARQLLLAGTFLTVSIGIASAAPPASCAYKFIGTWAYSGGTTVIAPGGIAYPKCAMCVPTQTWTCQGNTYLFSNSGPPGQFSGTLSSDGRQLISGGIVATRVGGAARGGDATANKTTGPKERTSDKKDAPEGKQTRVDNSKTSDSKAQPSTPQPGTLAKGVTRNPASCSDITGTSSSTSPNASHCRDADRAVYAARQIRQNNPQLAAVEYKKAAAAARRAGDTSLELSILREAIEPATVVEAPAKPGGAGEIATGPAIGSVPRMWDGSRQTCSTANDLEKNTAGWYVMCSDDPLPVQSTHRPHPDPLELSKQARQACGSYSRDTQQCFADFKLKLIIAGNPGLQETCEKEAARIGPLRQKLFEKLGSKPDTRERFLECVDNVYLYGSFDGPPAPKNSLRETLRKRLAGTSFGETKLAPDNTNRCWSPGRCCQAGHGLKPTPGAFGGWSCQPLGLLALNTAQAGLTPKDEAELAEPFEDRINEAVASAVAAAIEAFGKTMTDSDRDACAAAAFAAVHARLKGGSPEIPEQCRTLANAARGYFAAYTDGHVNNSNSAIEDLLANFRSDLGTPLPGMIGLTPDETARKTGECMIREGREGDCK